MLTWLVTGASGFLGRHVLASLVPHARSGDRLIGLDRVLPAQPAPFVRHIAADLGDETALRRLLDELHPDIILHAAGRTPPASAPELHIANVRSTANLLAALSAGGCATRVVLVGSAAELGPVPVKLLPAAETLSGRPVDPYGISKLCATWLGLAAKPPLEVVVGRIFNLVGPGLPVGQAFGRFAARLAAAGPLPHEFVVGNLTARRDFVDVRDAADALIALAIHGLPRNIYHIGSGRSHSIGLGLDLLIGLSGRHVDVVVRNGGRGGPTDSYADITKIRDQTPWTPRLSLEQSLADLWHAAQAEAAHANRPCLPAA